MASPSPSSPIKISLSLQVSYLFLFLAGVFCSLWEVGYSPITLGILAAAPLALLLSRLPWSWFPELLRQLIQLGIGACALAWFKHRAPDTPLDLALIECAAIIGLALLIGGILREHSLLAILSIALVGFGGLTPGRNYYFQAFALAAVFSIIILYQTRNLQLSCLRRPSVASPPRHSSTWEYRVIHFLVVVVLIVICMAQFPLREKLRTHGLAPVSFQSEQDLEFPQLWQDWFKPTKYILTRNQAQQETDGGENPFLTDKQSIAQIATSDPGNLDARDGSGGAASSTPGTDLVFRAYTPAKLYWVMQIYDTYDGNKWSRSASLLEGKNSLDSYEPADSMEVIQNISIEKPQSLRLPYAHKLKQAALRNKSNRAEDPIQALLQRQDAVTIALKTNNIPEPPWHYRVQSHVPIPDLRLEPKAWQEPERNYGWHCRSLPQKVITTRLRNLALNLTENVRSPMEKANILRDYLRQNFTYNLEAPAIPENSEVVDYFLFESREGYCQHYAQALVVLARLAGLHARLVNGYSPGKYNVLANYFEVYEYHAHAWAQIFIEPYGWLTYDGVPPGELRQMEPNSLLNALLDPFGDTWGDRPPELSYKPPQGQISVQAAQKKRQELESKAASGEAVIPGHDEGKISRTEALYDEILSKAMQDNNTLDPDLNQLTRAALAVIKERLWESLSSALSGIKASLAAMHQRLLSGMANFLSWLRRRTIADYGIAVVSIAFLATVWHYRHAGRRFLRATWRRYRCHRLWRRIQSGVLSPPQEISTCHQIVCTLLELAHFHRPAQIDLIERADLISPRGQPLCEDYRIIAVAAAHAWYGRQPPDATTAAIVRKATGRFREKIRQCAQRNNLKNK